MTAPSKILVVDDEPALCELIEEVLRSAGIAAEGITDSAQAATRLREEKFDGAFLDVNMPPPDGIDLTRQMRSAGLNLHTPIVIITGERERGLMARAFAAGANLFLFKPVDRAQLLRLVRIIQGPIERERRRFRRIRVSLKVSIESGQDRLDGKTLDLSLNGMLVQAGRAFPVGVLVQTALELSPELPPLHAAARVVRQIGEDRMGLQFESLGMTESERLGEFLVPLVSTALERWS